MACFVCKFATPTLETLLGSRHVLVCAHCYANHSGEGADRLGLVTEAPMVFDPAIERARKKATETKVLTPRELFKKKENKRHNIRVSCRRALDELKDLFYYDLDDSGTDAQRNAAVAKANSCLERLSADVIALQEPLGEPVALEFAPVIRNAREPAKRLQMPKWAASETLGKGVRLLIPKV